MRRASAATNAPAPPSAGSGPGLPRRFPIVAALLAATAWPSTTVSAQVPREYIYAGDQLLVVQANFADVPPGHPYYRFANLLAALGITGGCGGGSYCPDAPVTREQMAVFLLRAKEGTTYVPPPCTVPVFADVPCSSNYAPWINELARREVTGGCGGGNYCPGNAVTRQEMAVFLLRTLDGSFIPPPCTVPTFDDVPCASPYAAWIQELAQRGITAGCGGGNYCPTVAVNRGPMAVFLVATFDLE